MSVKVSARVWESELSRPQMLVLLAMADHSDDDGGSVFPSVNRLAWKTGYKARQIRRILAQLRKSNYIMRVAPAEAHRGVEYVIVMANLVPKIKFGDWLAQEQKEGADTSESDEEDDEGGQKDTPVSEDLNGVSPETGQGGLARQPNHHSTTNKPSGGDRPKSRSEVDAEHWARRIAESLGMTDEEKKRVFG